MCVACVKQSQLDGQRKRGDNPKTKRYISVNHNEHFAYFISAFSKEELALIVLPRGHKRFGNVF
jgi:hypothetical protein